MPDNEVHLPTLDNEVLVQPPLRVYVPAECSCVNIYGIDCHFNLDFGYDWNRETIDFTDSLVLTVCVGTLSQTLQVDTMFFSSGRLQESIFRSFSGLPSLSLLTSDRRWESDEATSLSHPHRALSRSVFSPFQQSDCGRSVSVNYGSPSPFDGKAEENTSRHPSLSLRIWPIRIKK